MDPGRLHYRYWAVVKASLASSGLIRSWPARIGVPPDVPPAWASIVNCQAARPDPGDRVRIDGPDVTCATRLRAGTAIDPGRTCAVRFRPSSRIDQVGAAAPDGSTKSREHRARRPRPGSRDPARIVVEPAKRNDGCSRTWHLPAAADRQCERPATSGC